MAVYRLRGKVQNYAWGGTEFLPTLLQTENPQQEPWAEYWLGIHPKGPAIIETENGPQPLDEWLGADHRRLAQGATGGFEALPFLFKILDVREMLSIQLHPTREVAREGFAKEEALGIPRLAPDRNYKDENHKPEVMVALTDFWLLHGFRSEEAIETTLRQVPGWQQLQSVLEQDGVKGLYRRVMEAEQSTINSWLQPLYDDLANRKDSLSTDSPDYWAWQAFEQYSADGNFDRGIFSIYWFNLVFIPKGLGIFQGAGIPHAYLRGVNVELMANSDNVLRGGLTPKHIDVPELLRNIRTEEVVPQLLEGNEIQPGMKDYPVPVPDFKLQQIQLSAQEQTEVKTENAAIYMVLEGKLEVAGQMFKKGAAFLLPAGGKEVFRNGSGTNLVIYGATF